MKDVKRLVSSNCTLKDLCASGWTSMFAFLLKMSCLPVRSTMLLGDVKLFI